MKKLVFFLSLLMSLPAFSQGRDTVLAVHHLFRQKRGSGYSWAATGASVAFDEGLGSRAIRSPSENAMAAVVYGGVPLVVGVLQAQRFSMEREHNILEHYALGAPLPADIRRKLRRRHFQRTTHDVVSGF